MTKAMDNSADRPVSGGRAYRLARFFGFAFGVNGSGGELSIARSKSSVRRFPSSGETNSIDRSSAACCAADGFALFMGGV